MSHRTVLAQQNLTVHLPVLVRSRPVPPSVTYNIKRLTPQFGPLHRPARVRVVNQDAVIPLVEAKLKPLVLNRASEWKPGGGWRNGAKAQEEDLMLRSTYPLSLEKSQYPLGSDRCVYSPGMLVFRGRGPKFPLWIVGLGILIFLNALLPK